MFKKSTRATAQRGFFDAGLSLLILALSGTAVYIIEDEQREKTELAASQQTQTAQVLRTESPQ